MIYDCFSFLNEFDALEIRLRELADLPVRHVLVESKLTFSGKPKPLLYRRNRARFAEWENRIIHVEADLPLNGDSWAREAAARNAMALGLEGAKDGDLVIVSDADEIPSADSVERAAARDGVTAWHVRYSYYFLDLCSGLSCQTSVGCPRGLMKSHKIAPQDLRQGRWDGLPVQTESEGWHLSFLGGPEAVRLKLESFSHVELSHPRYWNPQHVRRCMEQGVDLFGRENVQFEFLPNLDSLPDCVKKDPARFRELVSPRNRAE